MDLQRLRLLQQMYEAHRLNQQKQIMVAQILVDSEGVDQGPGGIG